MKGILFSNLNEIVKNPEVISDIQTDDVWGILPYETAEVQGNALVTTEDGYPADLVLSPNLSGWHKVYIGTMGMDGGFMFQVKLDNAEQFTVLSERYAKPSPRIWMGYEQIREVYWCSADLTDRDLIFHKMKTWSDVTPVVWLRCVPMTEDEIAAYKEYMNPDGKRNLHVHYDNAFDYAYGYDSAENLVIGYEPLRRSHAKICSQEILNDTFDEVCLDPKNRALYTMRTKRLSRNREIADKMDWIVKTRADYLHSIGVKFYAAPRVSMSGTNTPFKPLHLSSFISEHPEYYIKTRDGRTCTICSFAYPEARRYSIEYIKRAVARGYDGVSLIFHRGMHLGFEQPVLDEFARRNGGLDARRVPMADPRLQDVWCDFMTQYVRELRDELDSYFGRHIPINAITGHSPEISRRVGIDIEALCREGLIDHFCAETMSTFENLTDCLADDGLIDLEKYKEQLGKRYIVRRMYGNDPDNVKIGTPQFAEISKKYGVEFFAGMNPTHGRPEHFVDWIKMQKELGAENISFFNYLEYTRSHSVMNAASMTKYDEIDPEWYTPTFYRVLSIDGEDISTYQPNWRC